MQVVSHPIARVDRQTGRAAIVEPDGKIYILNITESLELKDGKGVHMGMFLQPAMSVLEHRDAGEYPHKELIQYVQLAHKQESCLMMLLISLDSQVSRETREEASRITIDLLAEEGVKGWIVKRLTETRLPVPAADLDGLPNDELKKFIRSLSQ